MHPNAQLIERFYTAFQNHDGDTLAASYHPEAVFSDPVFVELRGPRVGAMWKMLATRAKDLQIEFRDVHADDTTGRAHWEAHYTFSETGRHVHNVIDASFQFRDGKIIRHDDRFDLWRWSAMALGTRGKLLGWFPPVQRAIRAKAARNLDKFVAR
jgi:ketosteroid isomerase-like protein